MLKTFRNVTVFFFLLLFCSLGGEEIHLRIIQTTDIHGELTAGRFPGFPKTAVLIAGLQKEAGADHTVYLDCGDLLHGTYAMSLTQGTEMIELLNAVKCDIFIPGNHDFEFGSETLFRRLGELKQTQVLAANLSYQGKPLKSWVMLQRSGLKIAVIGMTHPGLFTWLSGNQIKGISMTPADKALDRVMGEIMKEKPDLIILGIHAGNYGSVGVQSNGQYMTLSQLVRKYPQIQLVYGGHTHQAHFSRKLAWNTVFIQAPAHSEGIAVTDLYFDAATHKRLQKGKTRLLTAKNVPEPESLSRAFQPLRNRVASEGKLKAGETSKVLGPLGENEKENALTRLFCKALQTAGKCPVAFHGTNTTYRVDPGPVTRKQLFFLYPYETSGVVMTLSAEELKNVIEEQYSRRVKGCFQAVAGVSYTLDENGKCISLEGDGNQWDGKSPVRCAFSGYALVGAGERFPYLKKLAETKKLEYLAPVRTLVQNYLSAGKNGE